MKEIVIATLLFGLASCSDELVDPVPPASTTSSPPMGTGGAPPEPSARVRDVYLRNPLGGPKGNLLTDGDFELSILPEGSSGQYGWFAISGSGSPRDLLAETGGLCKSGLRCGKVQSGTVMLGTGTAAADRAPQTASIWFKLLGDPPVEQRPCDVADVYVIDMLTYVDVATLRPADKPDDKGWCEYSTEVEGSNDTLGIYIQVGTRDVLVDNAALLAAPELDHPAQPRPLPPAPTSVREDLARLKVIMRNRMPVGGPAREPLPGARVREPSRAQ